jgi:hypothetical protein
MIGWGPAQQFSDIESEYLFHPVHGDGSYKPFIVHLATTYVALGQLTKQKRLIGRAPVQD